MSLSNLDCQIQNSNGIATLKFRDQLWKFRGNWIIGDPWERFGLYNRYVVLRDDGEVIKFPAHGGELVPGSTEDLIAVLDSYSPIDCRLPAPMTIEMDPTYRCYSVNCGGHCFSAAYRAICPNAFIPKETMREIVQIFAESGGRVVRFDGGGDPLAHPDIRSGELPEYTFNLGIKSTILTSGDAFPTTNFERIGAANCYVRVSLNAATNKTRQIFHGNQSRITQIFKYIESYIKWLSDNNPQLPVGSSFLLSNINYHEVYECALLARNCGIKHFSIRRVLGPEKLRTGIPEIDESKLSDLLNKVSSLKTNDFRIFIPWRSVNEADLDPSQNEIDALSCWQSTFKTVIEPSLEQIYRTQLCGRYRGSGVGQIMQMTPLFESANGNEWLDKWKHSFDGYSISRQELIYTCKSCIDRGFIQMINKLLTFLSIPQYHYTILHLSEPD